MDQAHYVLFERLQEQGLKSQARTALADFIASFGSDAERLEWLRAFLEQHPRNTPIRHELYAEVIYPALLAGYRRNDPWSTLWLARTLNQLILGNNTFAADFPWPEEGLWARCFKLAPDSEDVRRDYLNYLVGQLGHAVHEWPAGILWGMDGATLAQCDELAETVRLARKLDTTGQHVDFLNDFDDKLTAYRKRL